MHRVVDFARAQDPRHAGSHRKRIAVGWGALERVLNRACVPASAEKTLIWNEAATWCQVRLEIDPTVEVPIKISNLYMAKAVQPL